MRYFVGLSFVFELYIVQCLFFVFRGLLQVFSCTSVLPCYLLFLFFPAHQWLSRALLCGHPCMLVVGLAAGPGIRASDGIGYYCFSFIRLWACDFGSLIGLADKASLLLGALGPGWDWGSLMTA